MVGTIISKTYFILSGLQSIIIDYACRSIPIYLQLNVVIITHTCIYRTM